MPVLYRLCLSVLEGFSVLIPYWKCLRIKVLLFDAVENWQLCNIHQGFLLKSGLQSTKTKVSNESIYANDPIVSQQYQIPHKCTLNVETCVF